jgi:hypothetical protein
VWPRGIASLKTYQIAPPAATTRPPWPRTRSRGAIDRPALGRPVGLRPSGGQRWPEGPRTKVGASAQRRARRVLGGPPARGRPSAARRGRALASGGPLEARVHWAAADGPCHHRARRLTPPAEATWRRPSRASGPSHDASAGAPLAAALVAAAAGVAGSGHTSAACEEAALCGAPCAAPTAADGQGRRGRSVAASTALRALRRRDQPPRPPHLGTACARRSRAQGSGPAATGARWPLRAGRRHLRHGPGARGGPLEEVDRDRVGRRRRRAASRTLARLAATALEEEGALLPFLAT